MTTNGIMCEIGTLSILYNQLVEIERVVRNCEDDGDRTIHYMACVAQQERYDTQSKKIEKIINDLNTK